MSMVPSLGETKQLFSTSTLKSHKGIKKKSESDVPLTWYQLHRHFWMEQFVASRASSSKIPYPGLPTGNAALRCSALDPGCQRHPVNPKE